MRQYQFFLNRYDIDIFGQGNGSPMATNVVLVVVLLGAGVVIGFAIC